MQTKTKDYEITEIKKINKHTNEEYVHFIVKGIVDDPEDLPKTPKGGIVYPQLKL